MIREGQINRDEALNKISSGTEINNKELEIVNEVFDKLRLSKRERNAILNLTSIHLAHHLNITMK